MLPLEARALFNGGGVPEALDAFSAAAPMSNAAPSATVMPLGSVPQLSSNPGAAVKVYLDFVGAAAQKWGSFTTTTTPAYDTDGDATTFTQNEIDQVREIWSRVAEKYSPFDVDVTTVDPGTYAYNQVARMVIGGDGAWSGGTYGGYSYVGGFTGETSNTGWIFAKNLGKGFPKYVAEATAHEAGHLFGLVHQSSYDTDGTKTDEYNHGSSATAPIMGYSYFADRGLWWRGPSSNGAASTQDDLFGITAVNGFGYRADDHGSTAALADVLEVIDGTSAHGAGIIERMTDVDYFRFSSTGGLVQLTADVAPYGPMLDLALSLVDSGGNVLAFADTASLGETVSALVPAGDYYLAVSSHGGYGDIGQYTISGTVVPEPVAQAVLLLMGAGWLLQRRRREMTFAHLNLIQDD
jgi:hypothetical protein